MALITVKLILSLYVNVETHNAFSEMVDLREENALKKTHFSLLFDRI